MDKEKDYIPEGFRKYSTVARKAHIDKLKAVSKSYGVPIYHVLDRALEIYLSKIKPTKQKPLP